MDEGSSTGSTTEPATVGLTEATVTAPAGRGVGSVRLPDREPGDTIGRYEVIEVLARGGMGVVYKAHDPELDRHIALKLLRSTIVGEAKRVEQRERMLREAQALAQLAHPNVITVFDAGIVDGDVFIAMELVEGATLSAWLDRSGLSRAQIVTVLVSAGEGLAAAHEAGLVHRDIKPSNIIVGDDGRVRVIDFGLARASASDELDIAIEDSDTSLSSSSERWLTTTLTRAGTVMGTPRYMAPEQHLGGTVDHLCDQYSYAATVHRAVYGVSPIERGSYKQLRNAAIAGDLDDPPSGVRVGRHLAATISRGLSRQPGDRFPSLRDMLVALRKDPNARLRRVAIGAGAAALVSLLAFSLLGKSTSGAAACPAAEPTIEGVWDHAMKERVRVGFAGSGRVYQAQTFSLAASSMDDYARRISTMRRESCESTRVRRKQSDEMFDLRAECLGRATSRLGALASVFSSSPSAKTVDKAIDAVSALPPVSACADGKALRAAVALPEDKASRTAVQRLFKIVARARTHIVVGDYKPGFSLIRPHEKEVRALGYAPLSARYMIALGDLHYELGRVPDAVRAYETGLLDAARAKQPALLAYVWMEYMELHGIDQDLHDKALTLSRAARVAIAQAGDDPIILAKFVSSVGAIWAGKGKYKKAVDHYRRALKIQGAAPSQTKSGYLHTLDRLAASLKSLGKYKESIALLSKLIASYSKLHGADHHKVATAHYNLALVYTSAGRFDQAWQHAEKARVMLERILQPNDARLALVLTGAAVTLKERDKLDDALRYLKRAVTIRRRGKTTGSPEFASTLQTLGEVLVAKKKYAEARRHLEQALAVRIKFLPANHNHIGESLAAIAGMLWDQGKLADATKYYERTRALYAVAFGKKHPFYAVMLLNLGELAMEQKKFADATKTLEQAVEILATSKGSPARAADARFVLAKALWASGDKARARKLAGVALVGFRASGKTYKKQLVAVQKWLRKNR